MFKALESGQWTTILPFSAVLSLCSYQCFMLFRIQTSSNYMYEPLGFGLHSFLVSAPTFWNSLPHSVCFCESLNNFPQKHLKTFYFQSAFSGNPLPQRLRFNFNFWHYNLITGTYLLTLIPETSARKMESCHGYNTG